ncbi:hypothetical protein I545_0294 [Mycobacterium kansasii 662]|nr:hypothetical protein I545_0294 [Mycobacterium kansasii 662]
MCVQGVDCGAMAADGPWEPPQAHIRSRQCTLEAVSVAHSIPRHDSRPGEPVSLSALPEHLT